jgi:hypothetical protein
VTKKHFTYEFEQDGTNQISFDYSLKGDDKIDSGVESGTPVLYLNRPGMITLARTLIKMAAGDYRAGFHVHLRKNFNADLSDALTIILSPDDAPPYD